MTIQCFLRIQIALLLVTLGHSEEEFINQSYEVHYSRGIFDLHADNREEIAEILKSAELNIPITKLRLGYISHTISSVSETADTIEVFAIFDSVQSDKSYFLRSASFEKTQNLGWKLKTENETKISDQSFNLASKCLVDAIRHAEFESPAGYFYTNTAHFYSNDLDGNGPMNVWIRNPATSSRAWFLKAVFDALLSVKDHKNLEDLKTIEIEANNYWRSPKVLRDPNVTIESIRRLDPFREQ